MYSCVFSRFPAKQFYQSLYLTCGRDSSVGIATRYRLDGPGIESRWEARFSKPVQPPEQRVPGLSRGWNGRGVVLTPKAHLQCRGVKQVRAVLLPTLRALVAYRKNRYLTFTLFDWLTYFICVSFLVDSVFVSKSVPLVFVLCIPASQDMLLWWLKKNRQLFYAVDKTLLTW